MTATKRQWPGPDVAPFKRGSLLEWVHPSDVRDRTTATDHYAQPDEWRDNEPFRATLVLTGTERGRSAARFMWAGTGAHTGNTFPMFMTDVADLMMQPDGVANATATGWWIVVKRGQNYGIMRLRAEQEPTEAVGYPDVDIALVAALWERHDADGIVSTADVARSSLIDRSRQWIATRLHYANDGRAPLPGVAVTRLPFAGQWRLTFAHRCATCNVWIPNDMKHPHDLEPAVWEAP